MPAMMRAKAWEKIAFLGALSSFPDKPFTLESAADLVRARLAGRKDSFLRLLEQGVFCHTGSPYRPLFDRAGCSLEDVRDHVRRQGLERTLALLRDSGVYVTFDEFKGRQPIRRGSLTYAVSPDDFSNPLTRRCWTVSTGGTTGAGTSVSMSLDHVAATAAYSRILAHAALGMDAPQVIWLPSFPGFVGPKHVLQLIKAGTVPKLWFAPDIPGQSHRSLRQRTARRTFLLLAGSRTDHLPHPENVRLDEPEVVAEAVHGLLRRHGACVVRTFVSLGLRICESALQRGLDLAGAIILGGGEPVTPGKAAVMHAAGARHVPLYTMTETDIIGCGCLHPEGCDEVHVFEDALALIQHPRMVPGAEMPINALYKTTLLPTVPKLMINVESDDYGDLDHSGCGCAWESLGFTRLLRNIRSFRKLTGESVTLLGTDALKILDELLPARFGGTALDYQLAEEEDAAGRTRLVLIVDPRVPVSNDQQVTEYFLQCLRGPGIGNDRAADHWAAAGTLEVRRERPRVTQRGKLMPLHLNQTGNRSGP